MKPNQQRVDFLLIRDIDAILNVFFDKFGAADEDVLWAMEEAYRKRPQGRRPGPSDGAGGYID